MNLMEQIQYCVSWENVPLELDGLSVDSIQLFDSPWNP